MSLSIVTLLLVFVAFPALVIYAAVSDVLSLTISNWISLALIASFVAAALLTGLPISTIGWHFATGFVVLMIGFMCFAFGWIGGGDAKVAASTALWFGLSDTMNFLLLSSVIGGVLTLGLLALRRFPLPTWAVSQQWIARLHDSKTGVPYGVALGLAALLVYPNTLWISGLNF
jgi:prepilin peptidase CpaA